MSDVFKYFLHLKTLKTCFPTYTSNVIQNLRFIMPPPLGNKQKMKLQRHVRGQIRGSWVCPVHLDYF